MVISSIPKGDSINSCFEKPQQIDATSFAYNDRNLISGLTSGAGAGAGTSQFDYDGNGSLTQITDARGQATIMAYDGFDRVKSVLDPLGNETLISRANFGNLLTIKRLNSSGCRSPK